MRDRLKVISQSSDRRAHTAVSQLARPGQMVSTGRLSSGKDSAGRFQTLSLYGHPLVGCAP